MKSIFQMELEDKFNRKIKYREKKMKKQRMIIGKQQEEIERLNNIIIELEKESYLGMIENQNNNDYAKGLYTAYKYINDKLQELKGVDKE